MRQDQNFVRKSEFLLWGSAAGAAPQESGCTEHIAPSARAADVPPDPAAVGHPKRLTDDGRRALAAFAQRMRDLAVRDEGRTNS